MIPTNVFVGFLGSGKTTAILDLLAHKPGDDRWAVLVNEYGDVSIDGAIFEGAGVSVRDVAGGCVCCATAPYLQVALHLLLTEAKPTRLIIETTGLGHPGRLLETLRKHYADRLELRATIGLVTPDDAATMRANPVFMEQVDLADVLVLNKVDTATPGQVEEFQTWANGLFPPKELIVATEQGRLEAAWLDVGQASSLSCEIPEMGSALLQRHPGQAGSLSYNAHGWVFPADRVFDEAKLLAFLGSLSTITRLKGVFNVGDEHIVINRANGRTTVTPTGYRRDSRVEMFGNGDWNAIETGFDL